MFARSTTWPLTLREALSLSRCRAATSAAASGGGDSQGVDALLERARRFVCDEIIPAAAAYDQSGEYPLKLIQKAHDLGLRNIDTPSAHGGRGLSLATKCGLFESLAYGDLTVASSLMISELAQAPILHAGSAALCQTYVGQTARELHIAAYATTEEDAGSDLASARLSARAVDGGSTYVLNGTKTWITNAGVADWFFVLARTADAADERASRAFTGFIVDRTAEGLRVGLKQRTLGVRASDTRSLYLNGVRVPATHIVGEIGGGFKIAMEAFNRVRPVLASLACGVQARALDEAARYASARRTFGRPLIEHESIGFALADMAARLEASRLLAQRAAAAVDANAEDAPYHASIAKCFAAEAAFESATAAVRIHGGNGYSEEFVVEKLLRDSRALAIYGGTSDMQRLIIARRVATRYK